MRWTVLISLLLAAFTFGLVAFRPAAPKASAPLGRRDSARWSLSAQDATATAPALVLGAPAAAATPAGQDTTQSNAAVVIIWAAVILAVAATLFLIWRTRPGRKG